MGAYDERPWLRLYPPGRDPELAVEHADALSMWRAKAAIAADEPCIHAFEQTWTWAQIDAFSDALAVELAASGVGHGDRVAVYLQNDVEWPITILATWKLGAIVVPVNPMLQQRELLHMLTDSGASALVCLDSLYLDVARHVVADSDVRTVVVDHPGDWMEVVPPLVERNVGPRREVEGLPRLHDVVGARLGQRPPQVTLDGSHPAFLTYTSGTTGPSKGAINTHGNVAYNGQMIRDWLELGERDVVFAVAPLFHITGLIMHIATSWSAARPMVIFHRFDADVALEMIERWRATYMIGAITVYIALLERLEAAGRDFSSLRHVISGGAPVSASIVERFEQLTGLHVHSCYGLTETSAPSHLPLADRHAPIDPVSGTPAVGLPVPGVRCRVLDLDTGEEIPPGEVGEIAIAGPMVVPGYWGLPEETEASIPGGELRTGDVGFMDAEGWFYVVDRKKDQINAGGYKIWPREVEDVLYEHPAVREASVVGVPDPYRGETVKAYVALVDGTAASPDELIAFCRERMAAYKYPREVEILDALPRTLTGKFLRRELRVRAAGESAHTSTS